MVREPLAEPKRKRLEKLFDVAAKKAAAAATPHDFDYVADLLMQCVAAEPGNPVFVRAYLENLQKKFGNVKKVGALAQFKELGARSALKKALAQEQWDEVIRQGLKVLVVNPWDLPTLTAMATAAQKSEDHDCEISYLKAALMGSPKDYACNRLMALAMMDRGLLDQAIIWWHRVEDLRPTDEEAKRSIAALTVQKARSTGKFDEDTETTRRAKIKAQQQEDLSLEQQLRKKIADGPEQLPPYLELSQFYANEERYGEAEELLAKAFELSDGDVDIRDRWEDCQIRHLRQKLQRAADPEKKKELERLYLKKDTELHEGRVERFPNNLGLRYELGYRYMRLHRYDDAIRELQQAKNDPRKRGGGHACSGRVLPTDQATRSGDETF